LDYVNMADLSGAIMKLSEPPSDGHQARAVGRPERETSMVALVELLFFAYRDFTSHPDEILAEFEFGRAHHRVLHFVERYPGLRVADLLDILKITKQSLARVLRQLVAGGFIEQRLGKADRRERRLYSTEAGRHLARRLLEPQIARVRDALAGSGDPDTVRAFLTAMIEPGERARVEALLPDAVPRSRPNSEAQ
jgi:DNA-binding MarR family transcriptional regulator